MQWMFHSGEQVVANGSHVTGMGISFKKKKKKMGQKNEKKQTFLFFIYLFFRK